MIGSRRIKYFIYWTLLVLVLMTGATASQAHLEKEQVMTALLYNFIRFVTWPDSSFAGPNSPLVIAVQGKGAMQREIAKLNGRQIDGRSIVVRRLGTKRLPSRLQPCHVLYIPRSNSSRWAGIKKNLRQCPVLTVSDTKDFALKGGILHLEGKQILHFCINLDSAEQAELSISSKLFRLAKQVIKNGQIREGA